MLLQFIETSQRVAEVNLIFFESGHSQNEGDAMHAAVERNSRNIEIFTPQQWVGVLKTSKIGSHNFKVEEMRKQEFKDWNKAKENYFGGKFIMKMAHKC